MFLDFFKMLPEDKISMKKVALPKKEFIGNAGAGAVEVIVDAALIVKEVRIDHTFFSSDKSSMKQDIEFLQDLIKAAVNDAIEKNMKGAADMMLETLRGEGLM